MDYDSFLDLVKRRRSTHAFKPDPVPDEYVDKIIEAALRSPSGRAVRPWEFVVVKDKALLEKLSVARPSGAVFIKDAAMGIVVCGDPSKSHLWIEDCSIVAVTMQYAAHSMGLGTRWSQMRGNSYNDSRSSRDYIAGVLGLPDNLDIQCIVAIGYAGEEMVPYSREDLRFDKVSYEHYGQKNA